MMSTDFLKRGKNVIKRFQYFHIEARFKDNRYMLKLDKLGRSGVNFINILEFSFTCTDALGLNFYFTNKTMLNFVSELN